MSLSHLEEFLNCIICLEKFKDPRFLNCHHTFCEPCLSNLVRKKGKLPCPLCSTETPIPEDGTKGLAKNFTIKQMVENAQRIMCDECDEEATWVCIDCEMKMGHLCKEQHSMQESGATANHCIIRSSENMTCKRHNNAVILKYCLTCRKSLCKICSRQHQKQNPDILGHDVLKMTEYYTYCSDLVQCIPKVSEAIEMAETRRDEVTKQVKLIESYNSSYEAVKEEAKRMVDNFPAKCMVSIEKETKSASAEIGRLFVVHTENEPLESVNRKIVQLKDTKINIEKALEGEPQSVFSLLHELKADGNKLRFSPRGDMVYADPKDAESQAKSTIRPILTELRERIINAVKTALDDDLAEKFGFFFIELEDGKPMRGSGGPASFGSDYTPPTLSQRAMMSTPAHLPRY